MGKTANEYLDSLFEGMTILIDKKIEEISFDTTIVCTITDDSNSKNGVYQVSNGSSVFNAYSDVDNYKKGVQVRVNIPEGDYAKQKYIVGKYASEDDASPITYISPTENIINITGNLIKNPKNTGIIANGPDQELLVWNQKFDKSFMSMQENNIYNTIILKADFKTVLSNYNLIKGNYGLRLVLYIQPSMESTTLLKRYVELDSSDMFGNPYTFSIWSPQAKVIKIDTMGIVAGAELILYQKGNFESEDGPITPFDADNIFINKDSIVVGVGCDLSDLEDNTLQLYTESSLSYKYGIHNDDSNLKTMGILWLNKDDNNRYIGFSDGVYDKDYDELDYLERAKEDTRLLDQKGKEGVPQDKTSLNLAANIEEAEIAILKAVDLITKDLTTTLREMGTYFNHVNSYKESINALIGTTEGADIDTHLTLITDVIKSYLLGGQVGTVECEGAKTQYQKVLKYGYNTWRGKTPNPWPDDYTYYGFLIRDRFERIKTVVDNLMNTQSGGGLAGIRPNGSHAGLLSIYDTYKIRIDRIMATIYGYLGWLNIKDTRYEKDYKNYKTFDKEFPSTFFPSFDLIEEMGDITSGKDEKYDEYVLKRYQNKKAQEFILYQPPDLSKDDNKYCIYWYRWEKNYIPPENDSLLPSGWRRLQTEDFNAPHDALDSDKKNIGLSSLYYYDDDSDFRYVYHKTKKYKSTRKYYQKVSTSNTLKYVLVDSKNLKKSDVEAGKYYVRICSNDKDQIVHAPKVASNKGLIKRYMQNDTTQEKYKVVLFYNHQMYTSNELVFTNSEVVPDKTTLDKGDILTFEHKENSSEDFQIYNITNYLRDNADATKSRQIRCHYDGLQAKDNAFVNGQIYWYVPANSTMLAVDKEDLTTNRGFTLDDTRSEMGYSKIPMSEDLFSNQLDLYIKNEDGEYEKCSSFVKGKEYYEKVQTYYCFYKKIEAKKKNNAEDIEFEWDRWDYTNGTKIDNRDFWYQIKPYYESTANNNEIKCVFLKHEDVDEVSGSQVFTFGVSGTSGTKYTLAITPAEDEISTTDTTQLKLKAQLKDANNKPLKFNVVEDFGASWDYLYWPLLSDGVDDTAQRENITKTPILSALNDERYDMSTPKVGEGCGVCGILNFSGLLTLEGTEIHSDEQESSEAGSESAEEPDGRVRQITLNAIYKVPWSKSNDYYIQGPSDIIYNSLGTLDGQSIFATPYKIFAKKVIKDKNNNDSIINYKDEEIQGVSWSIKYFKKEDNTSIYVKEIDLSLNTKESQFYAKYMPKLANNNTLVPAPLYLDNLDCYPIVIATIGKGTKKEEEIWRQPIVILQNRYSSSMLNDWDGTFEINEENGTIMSTMVGAGKKEDDDNTFSGVLMGNVALGAEMSFGDGSDIGLKNHDGLGIYGFHHGGQSFGLNVNGSAFFGKAGKGRIIFNGDYGAIASSGWFSSGGAIGKIGGENPRHGITNAGTEGMCIDLENGHIDAYNFKLTSKDIYINGNPDDPHASNDTIRPEYRGYYLKIGNELQTGYLGLTKDGELQIRVNNFQLTSQLGNQNLLRQTSPRKDTIVVHYNNHYELYDSATLKTINGKYNFTAGASKLQYVKDVGENFDEDNKYHYTWTVDKWINSNGNGVSNWDIDDINTYNNESIVKNHGNVWRAKSNISGLEKRLPPGNTSDDCMWVADVVVENDRQEEKNGIIYVKHGGEFYQQVKLRPYKTYTLAGYVNIPDDTNTSNTNFDLIINTVNPNNGNTYQAPTIEYSNLDSYNIYEANKRFSIPDDSGWHYFRCAFNSQGGYVNTGVRYNTKKEFDNVGHSKYIKEGNVYVQAKEWNKDQVYYLQSNDDEITGNIGFKCSQGFKLWHVQLEEGGIATAWSPAPEDVEEASKNITSQYDQYKKFDDRFNELFMGPSGVMSDGIQLIGADQSITGAPELYINASYIATGILRSKNWNGYIRAERKVNTQNTITYASEEAFKKDTRTKYKYDSQNRKYIPTYVWVSGRQYYLDSYDYTAVMESDLEGTYIDLNTGKMWAANFELNAWRKYNDDDSESGLYLNSNPSGSSNTEHQYYIRIGRPGTGYLGLSAGGKFIIQAKNFKLDAWKNESGVYINSNPGDNGYYFKIGGTDGSITLSESGSLNIQAKNFKLDAWDSTNKKGIFLDSKGDDYYLKVGDIGNNNYITVSGGGHLKIYAWNSSSLASGKGVIINSNPADGEYYFKVGYNNLLSGGFISLDDNGKLDIQAKNFKLDAWGLKQGLILDSNPSGDNDPYLLVGDTAHYIRFEKDGNLYIKAQNFNFNILHSNGRRLYLNSDGTPLGYYFYIGDNDHYMYFKTDGEVKIKVDKFELDAWKTRNFGALSGLFGALTNDGSGLYLNSDPGTGDYFRVGNSNNYLKFNAAGKLDLKASSFNLAVGTTTGQHLFLTSHPTGTDSTKGDYYYLRVGNASTFLSFDKNGYFNLKSGSSSGNHLFLNSNPTATQSSDNNYYYFRVGNGISDTSNFLSFDKTGKLDIRATNFHLKGGSFTGNPINGIQLTSDTDLFPIVAGKGFAVDWNGDVYAENAKFYGNIYLNSQTEPTKGGQTIGTQVNSCRIYGPSGVDNDNCIYFDNQENGLIHIAGGTVQLASQNVHLGKDADANGNYSSKVYTHGTLEVGSDTYVNAHIIANKGVWYGSSIYVATGNVINGSKTYHPGVDGSYKIKVGIINSNKLVFKKGILIDVLDKDDKSTIYASGTTGSVAEGSSSSTGSGTAELTFYAPTEKGNEGEVWTSFGSGDNKIPAWKKWYAPDTQGSNHQVWATNGTTPYWKNCYAPTAAGSTGQILISGGSGKDPTWGKLQASLVNFPSALSKHADVTIGTPNSDGAYVISMTATLEKDKTVPSVKVKVPAKTVAVTPPYYWICFNTIPTIDGVVGWENGLHIEEGSKGDSKPSGYKYGIHIGPSDLSLATGAIGDWTTTVEEYDLTTSGTIKQDVPVPVTGRVKIEVGASAS